MLILLITLAAITTHHSVWCAGPTLADYLVPPPAPSASQQSQATRLSLAKPLSPLASESRTVPQYALSNAQTLTKTGSDPGFISRMARWFGFSNQNYSQDQQTSAASINNYYYPRPQQHGTGNKEPCNLCNKYPWVPMMHNSVHYPWDPTKQNQLPGHNANAYIRNGQLNVPQIQHAGSSVKQRAVQFHYPPPQNIPIAQIPPQVANSGAQQPSKHLQYSSGPFIPMPIPNLSNAAQPPIYNARPFHDPTSVLPPQYPAQAFHQTPPATTSSPPLPPQQQLPSSETAHFVDSIASAHSEIHLDTVIPTQIPPSTQNNDPSFEIIKSHQLADYISSVEYPASFGQTHSFDVHPTTSSNHQAETKPAVSTGRYQHSTLSPYLNQHIPASQILTEPGSFVVDNQYHNQQQQQSTLQSEVYEQSTLVAHEPQYIATNDHGYALDNYASASIQNSSIVSNGNYDTWTLESNDYLYATTTPEVVPQNTDAQTTTTVKPDAYQTTEPPYSNDVEFVASVQTSKQNNKNAFTTKSWPQKPRDRETPKRLLDSPIQHLGSGSLGVPRPFTRDPSELGLRAVAKNHKLSDPVPFQHASNVLLAASPTPTSTYSSVDASGHFAGMSPPDMPTQANKQHPFVPFTTKNQPRPFESTHHITSTTAPPTSSSFSSWIHAQNTDLHTPAETMLVHVKTELDPVSPTTPKTRTTKYLTKILASNLRELLQREHTPSSKMKNSPNSLNIDIHTLQKNIDDWTEQEYTSLSHRPSTPTILGRSKHIPKEYLPSTTTTTATIKPQRQSKTTKGFLETSDLSASVNSLEPLYERGTAKRFQFAAINNNHIQDIYDSHEVLKFTTTTQTAPTQPSTTPTSSTTTTTSKPLYNIDMVDEEPEELWRKAKVSISPKTKEKVYVVTPQPRFFPQRQISSTSTTTTERPVYPGLGSAFKSPRFLVRPTPGNGKYFHSCASDSTALNSP